MLACGVVGMTSLPGTTACTVREQCETSFVRICGAGAPNCDGSAAPDSSFYYLSANEMVWESSPMMGTWLDFPGARSYEFIFPGPMQDKLFNQGWELEAPVVWISTRPDNGVDGGSTAVPSAGQLAQVTFISNAGFDVTNGACAEYYIRIEVHVGNPGGGAADASTE
jgi:hypothetical protein